MEVVAKLKNIPLSAQKARLVANLVRSMEVATALETLKFSTKKGAKVVKKILESAVANAENNQGADIDELMLSTIYVDEASSLKRIRARAKGRANRITKRCCHITIKLSDGVM